MSTATAEGIDNDGSSASIDSHAEGTERCAAEENPEGLLNLDNGEEGERRASEELTLESTPKADVSVEGSADDVDEAPRGESSGSESTESSKSSTPLFEVPIGSPLSNTNELFQVEQIIGHRMRAGKHQYRIR